MPSNLCDRVAPVKRHLAASPRPRAQDGLLWLGVAEASKDTAPGSDGIYASFDRFLKQAIREYYDRGWTTRKGNFIALLIASGGTAFALAKDSVTDGSGTKKVAIGAGLLIALQVGLRYALGGPLGLVLTVAAGASMVAYFIRNQRDIVKKVGQYKTMIADSHKRYDEVQTGWRDNKYELSERNLMIDGLMKQFLAQIDEA
jgi:hypothetical protein